VYLLLNDEESKGDVGSTKAYTSSFLKNAVQYEDERDKKKEKEPQQIEIPRLV
jgi:hypothetical protein